MFGGKIFLGNDDYAIVMVLKQLEDMLMEEKQWR